MPGTCSNRRAKFYKVLIKHLIISVMNLCHFNLCFRGFLLDGRQTTKGWDERRTTNDDDGRAHDGLNDGRAAGNLFFNAAEIVQKQITSEK